MSKGIIYITTTSVTGLIKIGKTRTDQFENRMSILEQNGYWNVSGLHRYFAVEVEDYDEKEKLIHVIFSKSQVANSELFALDKELAKKMLESFDGQQIYPSVTDKTAKKEKQRRKLVKENIQKIPNGMYSADVTIKNFTAKAVMEAIDGKFIVKKGSICMPSTGQWEPEVRKTAKIESNVLQEDVICKSPSSAGWVVLGRANNGWTLWVDDKGELIDKYRRYGDDSSS